MTTYVVWMLLIYGNSSYAPPVVVIDNLASAENCLALRQVMQGKYYGTAQCVAVRKVKP